MNLNKSDTKPKVSMQSTSLPLPLPLLLLTALNNSEQREQSCHSCPLLPPVAACLFGDPLDFLSSLFLGGLESLLGEWGGGGVRANAKQ